MISGTLHPYEYSNQNPLQNVWCLISTDDKTAIDNIVTGDAVGVKITSANATCTGMTVWIRCS